MAEKKAEKNLEEEVLRYIYNSRFYPDNVVNEDGPAFMFDNDLLKMIDDAKSYDEARNILIGALDDEKNLQLARNATRDYLESFGEEGNLYDWEKSFGSKLTRVPLNVDALPYDVVKSRANKFAEALGESNIDGLIEKMKANTVMGDWGMSTLSDGFKMALRDEMKKKLNSGTLTRQKLEELLDYSPNADEDYIVNKAFEYANRVNRKTAHENMGEVSKGLEELLFPYQAEKEKEGIATNPADVLVDVATFIPTAVGSAKYAKGKNGATGLERLINNAVGKEAAENFLKYSKLAGLGIVGGAMEPVFSRLHNVADALTMKDIYANEGADNEVSESEKIIDALDLGNLVPEIGSGIQNNIGSSAVGLAGRGVSRVLGNIVNKAAQSKAGKAVKNGIEALFGSKKNAVNSSKKLQKERKAIEEEINSFGRPNSSVSTEDLVMNRNRLNEIAKEEQAIMRGFANSAQNKAQTALDALLGAYVMKSGLDPQGNARKAAKNAFLVDFLGGSL